MRKIRIIAIICAALALASFFYPYQNPYLNSQRRNMETARKHALLIGPQISADPRFHKVELFPYTASGGCLLVRGEVQTETDLATLKEIVKATNPPVKTQYMVFLGSELKEIFK